MESLLRLNKIVFVEIWDRLLLSDLILLSTIRSWFQFLFTLDNHVRNQIISLQLTFIFQYKVFD